MPNPTDAAVALSPKFGDWMRGIYASERNPYRDGMYVRTIRRSGRCNPGTYFELTDGRGNFWQYPRDSVTRLDRAREIDATRAQAPAAGEWLPIESAPTERDVLVYAPESPFPYRVASLCEHVQGWIWLDINADRIGWPVVAWRELTPPDAAMTAGLAGGDD